MPKQGGPIAESGAVLHSWIGVCRYNGSIAHAATTGSATEPAVRHALEGVQVAGSFAQTADDLGVAPGVPIARFRFLSAPLKPTRWAAVWRLLSAAARCPRLRAFSRGSGDPARRWSCHGPLTAARCGSLSRRPRWLSDKTMGAALLGPDCSPVAGSVRDGPESSSAWRAARTGSHVSSASSSLLPSNSSICSRTVVPPGVARSSHVRNVAGSCGPDRSR